MLRRTFREGRAPARPRTRRTSSLPMTGRIFSALSDHRYEVADEEDESHDDYAEEC